MGYNPLKGQDYDETFLKNKACDIELSKKALNEKYGDHCYSFMSKLLARYSQFRCDSEQALSHAFLTLKADPKDKEESSSTVEEKNKLHQISAPTAA